MVPLNSCQDGFPLFPFSPPLIGAAGKTGKGQPPEIPGKQENGKNGKPCECSERLADACLRRLSPEALADAFREVREGTP